MPNLLPPQAIKLVMGPIEHGLAASERNLLESGVPIQAVIDMLMEHVVSLTSRIEPPGVRAEIVKQLVADIAPGVRRAVERRNTTPGGVILPKGRAA